MKTNSKSLVEQTADKILDYIIENNLSTGDKLPNEYNLAEDLSVSRSTIREAIRALTSKNVLEVRRGLGTFVSEKRGVSEDPLGFSLLNNTHKLIEDLFELRFLLEPRMAELAAINANKEDIYELKEIKKRIESEVEKRGSKHFELDIKFHSLIAEASGNLAMIQIVPIINQSIWLYNSNSYTSNKIKKEMIISHEEILEAIVLKKPESAYKAMKKHINTVRDSLE
ncbi:FadR/GntR family transcriptional regulator [Dolosigranulum pigrum]|uniref:FadR/GntR family transcriptional regulator n=1 Tax=Dolosigranulum pigrum TaxID=29394 RepID=UPI0019182BEC|nr:FadR/GntR family transcriptional regulator [Dolosigranulum pigrum]QTJ46172.1 FadR family transcriptional regulator [Dolosigranulum pigrum]QTJ55834.1 FadR family transcriptional regulator [Dolosigranulum pigrum]QTJ59691.1 FadR family transcriptional regulator [Dolosigranulum pigrum]